MDNAIQPFAVDIPEQALEDLRRRLAQTRWPEAETCTGWDQGMPLAYARELTDYWSDAYDWRRCERLLNQWQHGSTEIDGVAIHFIHRVSPNPDALPLLITHGWPGSILEFHKAIEPLADPASHGGDPADAFHLVIPSLPGYGFSGKPTTSGTSVEKIAQMWATLMDRLGYGRYVAQGGDWGSLVTLAMAEARPEGLAGVHVNMPIAAPDPDTMDSLTEAEQEALDALEYYQRWDSGYARQQGSRPQTLAYCLADSPVGQMSWIVEKFCAWTDCERDGVRHPENALTRDELLDNVMLYWLNNAAGSSARLYWESFHNTSFAPIDLPVGCSLFPKEILRTSRRWAEKRFHNLIHWNELPEGGHFAAFEQPGLYVEELRRCFRALR
ncbi:MAG: epoxide hydrolase family protein [Chromatocurvus sp.]